jgi:hypothetical protein
MNALLLQFFCPDGCNIGVKWLAFGPKDTVVVTRVGTNHEKRSVASIIKASPQASEVDAHVTYTQVS